MTETGKEWPSEETIAGIARSLRDFHLAPFFLCVNRWCYLSAAFSSDTTTPLSYVPPDGNCPTYFSRGFCSVTLSRSPWCSNQRTLSAVFRGKGKEREKTMNPTTRTPRRNFTSSDVMALDLPRTSLRLRVINYVSRAINANCKRASVCLTSLMWWDNFLNFHLQSIAMQRKYKTLLLELRYRGKRKKL